MLRYKYALYALLLALISACSNNPAIYRGDNAAAKEASYEGSANASAQRAQSASAGERLGTQWGDEMTSRVTTVDYAASVPHPSPKPASAMQTKLIQAAASTTFPWQQAKSHSA